MEQTNPDRKTICKKLCVNNKVHQWESNATSLKIFPEEVWLIILNQLKWSTDILNVFHAFPELNKSFYNKKPEWLFDQVLPHLTKYLVCKRHFKDATFFPRGYGIQKTVQMKNLLNLRLVSKRWNNVVQNSMKNYSSKTSIDKEDKKIQENQLGYQNFHFGASIFRTGDQVEKFMETMSDFQGNPFPGKFVFVHPVDMNYQSSQLLVLMCINMFEKFGKHVEIFNLAIFNEDINCHLELCKNILRCVSNLSNLRSLTIKGFLSRNADKLTREFFEKEESQVLFPKLVNLEKFKWQVENDYFMEEDDSWGCRMMETYANVSTLKSLGFSGDIRRVLDRQLRERLAANLAELHFQLGNEGDTIVKRALESLPVKNLKTLYFSYKPSIMHCGLKVNITEILRSLKDVSVESVVFEDLELTETRNVSSGFEVGSIKSILFGRLDGFDLWFFDVTTKEL